MCVCMFVCVYVCVYIYMCVCVCVCVCVCLWIYLGRGGLIPEGRLFILLVGGALSSARASQ
jgi:hypothetical protein